MNILAIDTSLSDISVGCSTDADSCSIRSLEHNRDALRKLPGMMQDVLREVDLNPSSISVVACTQGPGSFTGLRVGIAAAKAFADSIGAVMVGVSTLRLLAMSLNRAIGDVIVPLIEARTDELYYGLYTPDTEIGVRSLSDDAVISVSDLKSWLSDFASAELGTQALGDCMPQAETTTVLAGPALQRYGEMLSAEKVTTCAARVRIRDLLLIARHQAIEGQILSADSFLPVYLQASQAEIRAQMLENLQ